MKSEKFTKFANDLWDSNKEVMHKLLPREPRQIRAIVSNGGAGLYHFIRNELDTKRQYFE